jgi:hypothetical protein
MRGFFTSGKIKDLHRSIREQAGGNAESSYFINDYLKSFAEMGEVPDSSIQGGGFGGQTILKNALMKTLGETPTPAIIWLVTDNQPSVGDDTASDRDIEEFYKELQSQRVRRIYFFPLRLPFSGPLYKANGEDQLAANYSGPRGLLVYALLIDEKARGEFDRAINSFQQRLGQTLGNNEFRSFLIKPLEQDTITAKLLPGEKFRVEGNRIVGGDFEEGQQIHGDFKLELTSQLGQIEISKADIDVKEGTFTTGDFVESELRPSINPKTVDNFRPGPQNKKEFTVTLDFKSLHTRGGLSSWWHSMSTKRGFLDGEVRISIHVPPQNITVVPEAASSFSTTKDIYINSDPEVQKRIYKLDDLVQKMVPQQTINVQPRIGDNTDGRIPVHLSVKFAPSMRWLWLILLPLLLLAGLALWWKRRPLYRLTWDNGQFRACPDFRLGLLSGRSIEIDNRAAATIKKGLSGVRVRAHRDYMIDDAQSRLINPGGSDFNVSRRNDGAGVNFHFSKANAFSSQPKSAGGDIFGATQYGGGGTDSGGGGGGLFAPQKPVRKPTTGTKYGATSSTASPGGDDDFDLDSLLK